MCAYVDSLPDWAIFLAVVKNEKFGFDLVDLALNFAQRKVHKFEPVMINPVTEKRFDGRTRRRLVKRFEALVQQELIPEELSIGWKDWNARSTQPAAKQ
jgi:hypothetical protein